jgi:hypothetical protein
VGNEEGDLIFPDAYITPLQQAKYDKKVHQYTHKQDGSKKCFTTCEPPKTLNGCNDQQGAAFYHHVVVHTLATVLADAQDKRICDTCHPLIKNVERITVEGKPFATGFIAHYSKTQQRVENWMPKRAPIVTTTMLGEHCHHVHVGFQWGTPIDLSKVRAIERKGNKKQRLK